MSQKVVPFPSRIVDDAQAFDVNDAREKAELYQHTNADELAALRQAFDKARERWPIEIAELPEMNKKASLKK